MDLTIILQGATINIRVAIILKTERGYILELNKKGYYFFLGGRIKLGENSLDAAKREVLEETGLEIDNLEFVSILENFWTEADGHKVQEICFVYKASDIKTIDSKFSLKEFTKEEMKNMDIRPEIIKKMIIDDELNSVSHFIV